MEKIHLVIAGLLTAILITLIAQGGDTQSYGGGFYENSFSGDVTNSSTSTSSLLPVKVLSTNANRSYAKITNNSDTDIFLHLGYFATPSSASTTVSVDQGIRLDANGGSLEFDDSKLYVGQVWATSTASSKELIYVEK